MSRREPVRLSVYLEDEPRREANLRAPHAPCYNHLHSMRGPVASIPIDQFAVQEGIEFSPAGFDLSFYADPSIAPEDLREFLHEPVESLPARVCELIGPLRIVLTPYLEKVSEDRAPVIAYTAPAERNRLRSAYLTDETLKQPATLFFAVRDENPSEYHRTFFSTIAHLLSRHVTEEDQERYVNLLLTEMEERANGEVDEASWQRKETLPRRNGDASPATRSRQFREYVAQSFTDTMTLYLHGICCDIDVETGPRQLPSRWLRKRLEALYEMFPPPNGRPVLPEHLQAFNAQLRR